MVRVIAHERERIEKNRSHYTNSANNNHEPKKRRKIE